MVGVEHFRKFGCLEVHGRQSGTAKRLRARRYTSAPERAPVHAAAAHCVRVRSADPVSQLR